MSDAVDNNEVKSEKLLVTDVALRSAIENLVQKIIAKIGGKLNIIRFGKVERSFGDMTISDEEWIGDEPSFYDIIFITEENDFFACKQEVYYRNWPGKEKYKDTDTNDLYVNAMYISQDGSVLMWDYTNGIVMSLARIADVPDRYDSESGFELDKDALLRIGYDNDMDYAVTLEKFLNWINDRLEPVNKKEWKGYRDSQTIMISPDHRQTDEWFDDILNFFKAEDEEGNYIHLQTALNGEQGTVFQLVLGTPENNYRIGTASLYRDLFSSYYLLKVEGEFRITEDGKLTKSSTDGEVADFRVNIYTRRLDHSLSPMQGCGWNKQNPIAELESLATDGCYIAYDGGGLIVTASHLEWPKLEKQGHNALGVVLFVEGQEPFIIARTDSDSKLHWCKYQEEQQYAEYFLSPNKAFKDFDGLETQLNMLSAGESLGIFGDNVSEKLSCAFPWVQSYCDYNLNWYVPTIGQLAAIYKHKKAINRCLSAISGAQLLREDVELYWSCTQYDQKNAWAFMMGTGQAGYVPKLFQYWLRPVTNFISVLV